MTASLIIWHYLLFCKFVNAFVQGGSSARVSCHEESYSHMVSGGLHSIFRWCKLYSIKLSLAPRITKTCIELLLLCPKLANINWALCQTFSCPTINHTWIELLLLCLTHQQTSIELRVVATSTSTTIAKPQVSLVFCAKVFQHIQLFIHKQLWIILNQTFFILKCWRSTRLGRRCPCRGEDIASVGWTSWWS